MSKEDHSSKPINVTFDGNDLKDALKGKPVVNGDEVGAANISDTNPRSKPVPRTTKPVNNLLLSDEEVRKWIYGPSKDEKHEAVEHTPYPIKAETPAHQGEKSNNAHKDVKKDGSAPDVSTNSKFAGLDEVSMNKVHSAIDQYNRGASSQPINYNATDTNSLGRA